MATPAMDRFVAGPHFYNHDMFGGMRPGGDVRLLSKSYFGLAVSAFASAFVYIALRNGLLLMVCAELGFSATETQAVDRLAELPAAFSFFVGLIADTTPLVGYHRKAYMILGLLMVKASLIFLALAFSFNAELKDALGKGYVYLVTLLVGCVSVGSMVNFVSVHTMVVELSQRESLEDRGVTQAKYLITRVGGQVTARIVVFFITDSASTLHVPLMLLALTIVSILSLIMTIVYLDEGEDYHQQAIRSKCKKYWLLTQQKAMWRILSFVSCFAFALGFKFSEAQRALQVWSHVVNPQSVLLSSITTDCVMICTILVWRRYFMNTLWRRVFAVGPVVAIVSQVALSTLTISGAIRNQVFFTLLTGLTGVSSTFVALSTLVPVTEIAQEGSEGGVAGLALSFYAISKVFGSTFLSALQGSSAFDFRNPAEDTPHVRWVVAVAQTVTVVVNALSVTGVALLPMQKLDAQQLRTFGGFTRLAGSATVAVFLALLAYCVAFNVLLLIPSTARFLVAEGGGRCQNC